MTATSGSRVLIVEDETELLDEVASYFRRRGETVVTASSFNDGLRILNDPAQPIDVLISDARMPDGNGIDLIRNETKRKNGQSICILMTGHLEQSQIASDLQGVKVFYKPFAVSALYREMRAALSGGVVTDISRERVP
jgi:DNA-binding response OmpR family regulator